MGLTSLMFCSIINVMHNQELHRRLEDARSVAFKLQDNNLVKMWGNCAQLWNKLDNEFVQCRRYQKITPKYTEIAENLDKSLVVLEQQLTFGSLLKM
jgi:hypothetical protein